MRFVNTSAEIERDGGMAWAIDVTGMAMALTKDEARYWPQVVRIVPWAKEGEMWIAPPLEFDRTAQETSTRSAED